MQLCLIRNITAHLFSFCSLIYDNATNTYDYPPGVEVRVPGFDDIARVEYLDADPGSQNIPNWIFFVDYFVERGYERNKTIRAAPYDWRLAASKRSLANNITNAKVPTRIWTRT